MSSETLSTPRALRVPRLAWFLGGAGLLLILAFLSVSFLLWRNKTSGAPAEQQRSPTKEDVGTIEFGRSKWEAAGLTIEPVATGPLVERVWRTGRLSLNDDGIAHLFPTVEGVVNEVRVHLGQEVKAGDVLAVLDSREVGQAKLELAKTRLAHAYVKEQYTWTQTITRNAEELLKLLPDNPPIADLEKRFHDRPMGEWREKLLTAYARRMQLKTQYESARRQEGQGTLSESALLRMKADFETAQATYQAIREEARFNVHQQALAAEQKLREGSNAVKIAETTLTMMGFSPQEIQKMDPITEGASVSLIPLRALLSGTVIAKHAVRGERVGPTFQMFEIANLATLWLQADVFEADLPLVQQLPGQKINFKVPAFPEQRFHAQVFYTGDLIDKQTRAITLSGTAENPDRLLKPGMFIEVELTRPGGTVLLVPVSALQRYGNQTFVFVHEGGERFRRVEVAPGRVDGSRLEIKSGLSPGQKVVVEGGFLLKSEMLKELMTGE